ncbi:MAG: hypothetical protein IPM24_11620 [Bryobacterales bacterium]|nr:hypothetical protein [Bryobacterales bacterium]
MRLCFALALRLALPFAVLAAPSDDPIQIAPDFVANVLADSGHEGSIGGLAAGSNRLYLLAVQRQAGPPEATLVSTDLMGRDPRPAEVSGMLSHVAHEPGGPLVVLRAAQLVFIDPISLRELQTGAPVPGLVSLTVAAGAVAGALYDGRVMRFSPGPPDLLFATPASEVMEMPWLVVALGGSKVAAVSAADGSIVVHDSTSGRTTKAALSGNAAAESLALCPPVQNCAAIRHAVSAGAGRMLLVPANYRRSDGLPVLEADESGAVRASHRLRLPAREPGRRSRPVSFAFAGGHLFVGGSDGSIARYSLPVGSGR